MDFLGRNVDISNNNYPVENTLINNSFSNIDGQTFIDSCENYSKHIPEEFRCQLNEMYDVVHGTNVFTTKDVCEYIKGIYHVDPNSDIKVGGFCGVFTENDRHVVKYIVNTIDVIVDAPKLIIDYSHEFAKKKNADCHVEINKRKIKSCCNIS